MSRSQPSSRIPNPCQRWIDYNGQHGHLSSFDHDKKERVTLPLPFTFMWLEEMKAIGGFVANQGRIYSNEVRDTTTDEMIVKHFRATGGTVTIAEGKYRDIKDKVEAAGGYFVTSIYLAMRREHSDSYMLGNLRLKGAALSVWIDFSKKHGRDIEERAVTIAGFTEGKTGSVTYRVPRFEVSEVSAAAQSAALALDGELQAYLVSYLKRTTTEQRAEDAPQELITASDIPF